MRQPGCSQLAPLPGPGGMEKVLETAACCASSAYVGEAAGRAGEGAGLVSGVGDQHPSGRLPWRPASLWQGGSHVHSFLSPVFLSSLPSVSLLVVLFLFYVF